MGTVNSVPIVSQIKSTVQLACGDVNGAAATQEQFLHVCPIFSQVTSGVYLIAGEKEKALHTQKRCANGVSNMVNGLPAIGHIKGLVHYACGDKESGNKAMKSATRSTGVMSAGALGFFIAGPFGAIVGGIKGGLLIDSAATVITGKDSGYIAGIRVAVENPSPGALFDLAMFPFGDALTGQSGGTLVDVIQNSVGDSTSIPQSSGENIVKETVGIDDAITLNIDNSTRTCVIATAANEKKNKCTCDEVNLKTMLINMQGINSNSFSSKYDKFKTSTRNKNPDIIIIVETWLNAKQSDDDVKGMLGLHGYTFFRRDRYEDQQRLLKDDEIGMNGKCGGGILIAWKNRTWNNVTSIEMVEDISEDYGDTIKIMNINASFDCTKCNENRMKSFRLLVVYRSPDELSVDEMLMDMLGQLAFNANWIMAGYFNWKHNREIDKLEHTVYEDMAQSYDVWPPRNVPTHINGRSLVTVISSPKGLVKEKTVSDDPISDHMALFFSLKLGKDYLVTGDCQLCQSSK